MKRAPDDLVQLLQVHGSMTGREAAKRLGVHENTVYAWLRILGDRVIRTGRASGARLSVAAPLAFDGRERLEQEIRHVEDHLNKVIRYRETLRQMLAALEDA